MLFNDVRVNSFSLVEDSVLMPRVDVGRHARLRKTIVASDCKIPERFVIGEDWCPDVWRGLPVMAKLGELTGMEVRYFLRDQNKDIMAEFLKDGEFESIPAVVLYDGDHNYLGHWIERSDRANSEMPQLREILAGKERDTPEYEEAMQQYRARTWDFAEGWRDSQVSELRALLEEALG